MVWLFFFCTAWFFTDVFKKYKPSRALVQAQPLEGSLIIWISSITATSSEGEKSKQKLKVGRNNIHILHMWFDCWLLIMVMPLIGFNSVKSFITRCVDTAHLNGAGQVSSRPTARVHKRPLLSSHQVTWHILVIHTRTYKNTQGRKVFSLPLLVHYI